jgi:hypothetical protein
VLADALIEETGQRPALTQLHPPIVWAERLRLLAASNPVVAATRPGINDGYMDQHRGRALHATLEHLDLHGRTSSDADTRPG